MTHSNKKNNFNVFLYLGFLLFLVFSILLIYIPISMVKNGYDNMSLFLWFTSVLLVLVEGSTIQTEFNYIDLGENEIKISRPFMFLKLNTPKNSVVNIAKIKKVSFKQSDRYLRTSFFLLDEKNEIIEYFNIKKSKKIQKEIESYFASNKIYLEN